MAEKLEIIGSVKLDSSGADASIKSLSDKLKEAKASLDQMNAAFGEGSAEAKKAAQEVANIEAQLIKVKEAGAGAEQPIKSLNQQLKQAQEEARIAAETFGKYSPEVQKAGEKVTDLKKRLGDARTLSDSFNPGSKFGALQGAIQGAAGALTTITALQATFGKESDTTQKALLKVQSAMALSQGIGQINESIGSFKRLGTQLMSVGVVQKVVTAGQWLWNAAMAANPIGAVVAVVAALIAGIVALTSWLKKSADESKKRDETLKAHSKAIEENARAYQRNSDQLQRNQSHELALAKAKGASAAEIRKLELKLADEKVATERSARAKALLTLELEKNTLAAFKNNGATDEQIKKQEENVKKAVEAANAITANLDKAKIERVEIEKKQQVEIAQAETDARKKRSESASAARQKQKQDDEAARKETEAANKASEENIRKINQDLEVAKLKDSQEAAKKKLDQDYENAKKSVEQSKASQEQKDKELAVLKLKYESDVSKSEEQYNAKRLAEQRKYHEERKRIELELGNDLVQIQINSIKDANEKRNKELENNRKKEIEDAQKRFAANELTETEYLIKVSLIRAKYKQQEDKNSEADAKKKFDDSVKELDKIIANNDLAFQIKKDALDKESALIEEAKNKNLLTDEEYKKAVEKNAEDRKAIKKSELQTQLDYVKQFSAILTGLSDVLGKNTKAGKKAAIAGLLIDQGLNVAKITMDTIASTKAIAKKYAGTPGGQIPAAIEIGLNIAQGAISVAKSVQAAKKGISEINKAGGGGSESSGGGGGGGGDMSAGGSGAPIAPQANQTALPQDQINQLATANAATRAYVLESDVSGNQERITRINRAARIS